jgi:DnaJ-class molecular chaperone
MPNYYDILGVSQDADENEIKKAYRKLSLQYHPDRNQDSDTTSKFQEINEAFEVLGDPNKKSQHDMELKFGHGGGGGMHFAGGMDQDMGDINNIFNMMFGGGMGGFPGMPGVRIFHTSSGSGNGMHTQFFHSFGRPETIEKTVEITMEQSYKGCNIDVIIDRWTILNNTRTTQSDKINIDIPAGIDNGESLILRERGNNIINQMVGDVKITILINNQTDFERKGMDLHIHMSLSLKEALCGFVFEFDHLNGKRICMNNMTNNNIIRPGSKKVINGLGMMRNGETGNLVIEFEIKFPESITDKQKTALNEIFV